MFNAKLRYSTPFFPPASLLHARKNCIITRSNRIIIPPQKPLRGKRKRKRGLTNEQGTAPPLFLLFSLSLAGAGVVCIINARIKLRARAVGIKKLPLGITVEEALCSFAPLSGGFRGFCLFYPSAAPRDINARFAAAERNNRARKKLAAYLFVV